MPNITRKRIPTAQVGTPKLVSKPKKPPAFVPLATVASNPPASTSASPIVARITNDLTPGSADSEGVILTSTSTDSPAARFVTPEGSNSMVHPLISPVENDVVSGIFPPFEAVILRIVTSERGRSVNRSSEKKTTGTDASCTWMPREIERTRSSSAEDTPPRTSISSAIEDMPALTPSGISRPIVSTRSSLIANVAGGEPMKPTNHPSGKVGNT